VEVWPGSTSIANFGAAHAGDSPARGTDPDWVMPHAHRPRHLVCDQHHTYTSAASVAAIQRARIH
jgi:hypothetical protein